MRKKLEVEIGTVFGNWTVLGGEEYRKSNRYIKCRCLCGKEKFVQLNSLKSGDSAKCGTCSGKEKNIIHGLRSHPLYYTWHGMIQRCYGTKRKDYGRYGGRGITVCDRWKDSLENFIHDMGEKPSPKHSIDRINNDGNYEPSNCRWATPTQQASNKRMSKNNTSGTTGVYWNKRKGTWVAVIRREGTLKYLGSFRDKKDAIKARLAEESQLI